MEIGEREAESGKAVGKSVWLGSDGGKLDGEIKEDDGGQGGLIGAERVKSSG